MGSRLHHLGLLDSATEEGGDPGVLALEGEEVDSHIGERQFREALRQPHDERLYPTVGPALEARIDHDMESAHAALPASPTSAAQMSSTPSRVNSGYVG